MTLEDAEFIHGLVNDPEFLRFIGDKGVRTVEDARQYLLTGPLASYDRHGFGLWMVELEPSAAPVGMCGLLKRDTLPDADIGFAFLPEYRSRGYALESASAVLQYSKAVLGLSRIVAIVNRGNERSIRILEKIGMTFERMVRLSEEEPEIMLFASPAFCPPGTP
jgi:RimJ/RimL family protein N-acetyltransferase